MKKKEIQVALAALRSIKMPLIGDKSLRKTIITDHFKLLGELKKFESDMKDLETVHLGAFEAERLEVAGLQQRLRGTQDHEEQTRLVREIDSHTALFEAIKEYNKAAEDLGEQTVEIDPIDHEKFIEEIQKQDFTLGMMEDLYPMFQ